MSELLNIKEASAWATQYLGKNVTTSNIAYLIKDGRVRKIGENGSTQVIFDDLLHYYESYNGSRETNFKENTSIKTDIRLGDSKDILTKIPDNFVDLIVTSPPYADRRKNTYGGILPDKYVEWFLPISKELLRVLKPDGTFILNIKEKAENGERNTYVLELILALRKQGWLWTEEFVWHKKNSYPGKWPNRFRDSWERLLQFNKTKKFNMYQDAVRVPIGNWANGRLKNLSKTDKIRDNARNGSGFGKNISNWLGKDTVYPDNVLYLSTECSNKNHSAAFPDALPEWFIKLFTQENDIVLDPFAGSGTTLRVAKRMARNSIGIEIMPKYVELVKSQIAQEPLNLF
ncbi:MAG: site-specific DNA-methyltransferase [Prevotellaceae bacterium]|jgi:site-specific DNA-methyltransferase (adenine-specific)/site-specific DNA-methyltransferase (cytosine-N4-specific)|nr:site-specific DNA-methyltransferase [Prevotellaceae bacterium]